jgi:hypothetical protein
VTGYENKTLSNVAGTGKRRYVVEKKSCFKGETLLEIAIFILLSVLPLK